MIRLEDHPYVGSALFLVFNFLAQITPNQLVALDGGKICGRLILIITNVDICVIVFYKRVANLRKTILSCQVKSTYPQDVCVFKKNSMSKLKSTPLTISILHDIIDINVLVLDH